tara:strand:- start:733 stop:882 length:150 start_codon:yes stop_codon:yes gene_type:complete
MLYRLYISNGGKNHCYYQFKTSDEAVLKLQYLKNKRPNMTYTIKESNND